MTYSVRAAGATRLTAVFARYVTLSPNSCTKLDAVAKCLPARPGGTTPIVAWHEVPGKGAPESTHQQKGESPFRTGTLACP